MCLSDNGELVFCHTPPRMTPLNYTRAQALPEILNTRIAILDGAMGTMIQRFKLSEADYRGERFKDFRREGAHE